MRVFTIAGAPHKLDQSSVRILGRWTGADGVVHGKFLGSGRKKTGPHARGVRALCGKPWVLFGGSFGPASPKGLRRVDFLDFASRITCETCDRIIDQSIAGVPPKRDDLDSDPP